MTSAQTGEAKREAVTHALGSNAVSPRRRRRRKDLAGWLFVAPFVSVFCFTFLVPIGYAIYLSTFRQQVFLNRNSFVGAANYTQALSDPKFWDAFVRALLFLAINVPTTLILALVAALAIDSARLYGASFFRLIIFLPYAVPIIVAVLMWGYMYGDRFGLAHDLNNVLGTAIHPLTDRWMVVSMSNIVTWEFVGYNMIIFYAALRAVPEELYEAATMDGAGAIRTAVSIKIPALRGAMVICTVFSILGSFNLFPEPVILQKLAPSVITSHYMPNVYTFNLSFVGQQYNYAAAVAMVMAVFTGVIAYAVQLRGSRQGEL